MLNVVACIRRERCNSDIEGSAATRISSAKEALQKRAAELDSKKVVADAKEKEQATERMSQLAEKIRKLELTRREVCGSDTDCAGVAAVGGAVLDEEICASKKAGEALGSKFGGWSIAGGEDTKEAGEAQGPAEDDAEQDGPNG